MVQGVSRFKPDAARMDRGSAGPKASSTLPSALAYTGHRPPAAGPGRQRKRLVPDNLQEIQHFGSLERAKVNDFVRLFEQVLEDRQGNIPELTPITDQLTQLEQADPQSEPGGGPLQQPLLDQ